MQAFQEPAVSIIVSTDSFAKFKEQLSSFGLNPRDWRATQDKPDPSPEYEHARFILVHREDDDLRLGVNVHTTSKTSGAPTIADIELLLA
jgi:hypothetical protein